MYNMTNHEKPVILKEFSCTPSAPVQDAKNLFMLDKVYAVGNYTVTRLSSQLQTQWQHVILGSPFKKEINCNDVWNLQACFVKMLRVVDEET